MYDPTRRVDWTDAHTLQAYAKLDQLWEDWLLEGNTTSERIEQLYVEVKDKEKDAGMGWWTNVTMFRVPRLPIDALELVYCFAECELKYRKVIAGIELAKNRDKAA